jgi:thioredoxin reductase (NADPH)
MEEYEIAVVGAGPIGIEVGAALKRAGISFIQFEKGALAEVITRWPRNTQFFSSPEWIAIAGIPIQTAGQEIITGRNLSGLSAPSGRNSEPTHQDLRGGS